MHRFAAAAVGSDPHDIGWNPFSPQRLFTQSPASRSESTPTFERLIFRLRAEGTFNRDPLMGALDAINGNFGTWTAVTATQRFKREWKLRPDALACMDD